MVNKLSYFEGFIFINLCYIFIICCCFFGLLWNVGIEFIMCEKFWVMLVFCFICVFNLVFVGIVVVVFRGLDLSNMLLRFCRWNLVKYLIIVKWICLNVIIKLLFMCINFLYYIIFSYSIIFVILFFINFIFYLDLFIFFVLFY